MAGSLLASAIPRCSAKNSSVLTRILSSLNKPLGRPARRRTVSGERPSSLSFRGSVLETRNRLLIAQVDSITLLSICFARPHYFSVLLVGDVLHPIDHLAVLLLLNGDVRHARRRRRAMPVLLAGRKPDYITGTDLLDRPAPALNPSTASGHNESLAERMRVPCSSCTWLKRNAGTLNQRRDQAPEIMDRSAPHP